MKILAKFLLIPLMTIACSETPTTTPESEASFTGTWYNSGQLIILEGDTVGVSMLMEIQQEDNSLSGKGRFIEDGLEMSGVLRWSFNISGEVTNSTANFDIMYNVTDRATTFENVSLNNETINGSLIYRKSNIEYGLMRIR